ncbi:MAG: O-antigen ligase domain-containing protein [Bacteroidia bacterium]|nr:O-antigen ligase domain-containing protein [Bacteroidia bacterium]MBP7244041.1 O-antigen ligase domain-containing protein [Bacteroidia bacterium]
MVIPHPNSVKVKDVLKVIVLALLAIVLGITFSKGGIVSMIGLAALPFALGFVGLIIARPRFGMWAMFVFCFFANGITRYIDGPFGLGVDIILLLTALGVLFRTKEDLESPGVKNPLMTVVFIWFAYTVFEIVNPEARSFEAWFYAVRGVSLYFVATVPLAFILLYREEDLDKFISIWFGLSLFATFWGLKQMIIGVDSAEQLWLDAGAKSTHVLFGKLRVFSFYSDAGQFGAAQAHTGVVAGILAMGPCKTKRKKYFYIFTSLMSLYGMAISGTRGALFVAITGFAIYFLVSNNIKIIVPGLIVGILAFGALKFTNLGQNNDQVRRMRTALDPNDASLIARLENQKKLKIYLASRPIGGGIGAAGSWGQRFSPGSFLATTPLDSWYVKIWAESGIVGLSIYLSMLLFLIGNRFIFLFKMKDSELKFKLASLYGGFFGVCFASYGNQIFGQFPTGPVIYLSLVFMFLGETFVKKASLKQEDEFSKIS